jgi:hypothetical protein
MLVCHLVEVIVPEDRMLDWGLRGKRVRRRSLFSLVAVVSNPFCYKRKYLRLLATSHTAPRPSGQLEGRDNAPILHLLILSTKALTAKCPSEYRNSDLSPPQSYGLPYPPFRFSPPTI